MMKQENNSYSLTIYTAINCCVERETPASHAPSLAAAIAAAVVNGLRDTGGACAAQPGGLGAEAGGAPMTQGGVGLVTDAVRRPCLRWRSRAGGHPVIQT